MGSVHATITLKNVKDMGYAKDGYIKEADIRSITISALVDTGAMTLCISEDVRQELGLGIEGIRSIRVANGVRVNSQITEPVEIIWKDRYTTCRPIVIPGAEFTLLGLIPLEDMDLTVNPIDRELVGIHGNEWLSMVV
jgi:clan AA aspartic protease